MCVLKPLVALAIFSGPLTAPVQRAEAGDNRQGLRMPLPRTHYVNKHRRHRRYIYMAPVTRQPARSAPIEARPKPSRPRIIARSSDFAGPRLRRCRHGLVRRQGAVLDRHADLGLQERHLVLRRLALVSKSRW